jgi:hypothetical protein
MYNSGKLWDNTVKNWYKDYNIFTEKDVIVEIGAGNGSFLKWLPGNSTKIAFEPGPDNEKCKEKGLNTVEGYFDPETDIQFFKPTYIIMRHVLEHITNPKEFIDSILENCIKENIFPTMIIEVPLIENALTDARIEDWVYEHPHHFTITSLKKLFANWNVFKIDTIYDNEVVIIKANPKPILNNFSIVALKNFANLSLTNAREQLISWIKAEKKIALWGGAGKSSMFLYALGIDDSFGIVVDSDERKVGKYVPGKAIKIHSVNELINNPVDIIIATTSWRSDDIFEEIKNKNIKCESFYIFKNGKFVKV